MAGLPAKRVGNRGLADDHFRPRDRPARVPTPRISRAIAHVEPTIPARRFGRLRQDRELTDPRRHDLIQVGARPDPGSPRPLRTRGGVRHDALAGPIPGFVRELSSGPRKVGWVRSATRSLDGPGFVRRGTQVRSVASPGFVRRGSQVRSAWISGSFGAGLRFVRRGGSRFVGFVFPTGEDHALAHDIG
jgi:hypothetical protein